MFTRFTALHPALSAQAARVTALLRNRRLHWWLIFIAAALPSLCLLGAYFFKPRALGIDPLEIVLQRSGEWALRFLLLSLLCSPIRRLGWKGWARFRRMLGLYSFYYASLHLLFYVIGWTELDWPQLLQDVTQRPFIYLGFIAWLLLGVLAATSPKAIVKRIKKHWMTVHRLVFVVVLLAWIHLWMQLRASAAEAVFYGLVILVLMGERLWRRGRRLAVRRDV